jgi:hypothetical protein
MVAPESLMRPIHVLGSLLLGPFLARIVLTNSELLVCFLLFHVGIKSRRKV